MATSLYSMTRDPTEGLPIDQLFCINAAGNVIRYSELLEWKKRKGLI